MKLPEMKRRPLQADDRCSSPLPYSYARLAQTPKQQSPTTLSTTVTLRRSGKQNATVYMRYHLSRGGEHTRVAKSIISRAVSSWLGRRNLAILSNVPDFSAAATQVIQSLKCIIGFLAKSSHEEVSMQDHEDGKTLRLSVC